MPDDASPDELDKARRRGLELQATLPEPHWTRKQLERSELWALLVVPLALLWFLALTNNPGGAQIALTAIVTLMIAPVLWYRIKLGLHRGQRW